MKPSAAEAYNPALPFIHRSAVLCFKKAKGQGQPGEMALLLEE